nr:MAG TPA: hypothetical protein [Microviridae sp.]
MAMMKNYVKPFKILNLWLLEIASFPILALHRKKFMTIVL